MHGGFFEHATTHPQISHPQRMMVTTQKMHSTTSPELVSVVIPTFNRGTTINRAIDSVLEQGYPNIEIIVVDDGSTDDTAERMERYRDDSRVKYLTFPNGGVCTARNRGIRASSGEYIAMLDSDDYWLPGKLALQLEVLRAHPELRLVWTDMDAIDVDGNIVNQRYLRKMYSCYEYFPNLEGLFDKSYLSNDGAQIHLGHIAPSLVLGNLVHTSTVLARRSSLNEAGDYDQSVHPSEDQDYYYRVCKTGRVALIDTVTIHYQIGASDAATAESRSFELATSSLKVFERLCLREPDGASDTNRRRARRSLYRWVGRAALLHGDRAMARHYLIRSLLMAPFDYRVAVNLARTFV